MAKMGSASSDLRKFKAQLKNLQEQDLQPFLAACVKELAARLLAKVKQRTPVGGYRTDKNGAKQKIKGYIGGTLRRGWITLDLIQEGNTYTIELVNSVYYASYVEYGHRTANHDGWVPGQFMLTISEQELQNIAPKVLEMKISKFLKDYLK